MFLFICILLIIHHSVQGQGIIPGVQNICFQSPSATGHCRGLFPKFYYDPSKEICDCFVYGGCGGSRNRFDTLEQCMTSCNVQVNLQTISNECRTRFRNKPEVFHLSENILKGAENIVDTFFRPKDVIQSNSNDQANRFPTPGVEHHFEEVKSPVVNPFEDDGFKFGSPILNKDNSEDPNQLNPSPVNPGSSQFGASFPNLVVNPFHRSPTIFIPSSNKENRNNRQIPSLLFRPDGTYMGIIGIGQPVLLPHIFSHALGDDNN